VIGLVKAHNALDLLGVEAHEAMHHVYPDAFYISQ